MAQFPEELNKDINQVKTTAIHDGTEWLTVVKPVQKIEYINKGVVNVGKRTPLKATATLTSVANATYGTKFTLGTVPANKVWMIATVEGGSVAGVTFDDVLLNNIGIGFFLEPSGYNTKYLTEYFGDYISLQSGEKVEIMYHSDATGAGEQYISYYGWEIDLN